MENSNSNPHTHRTVAETLTRSTDAELASLLHHTKGPALRRMIQAEQLLRSTRGPMPSQGALRIKGIPAARQTDAWGHGGRRAF